MKLAIFFLATLFSLSTLACNREVQFIGTVRNLQKSETSFTFQLRLGRWFVPSLVCPMYEDEYEAAVIELPGSPRIKNGEEISGVLVFDEASGSYRIE